MGSNEVGREGCERAVLGDMPGRWGSNACSNLFHFAIWSAPLCTLSAYKHDSPRESIGYPQFNQGQLRRPRYQEFDDFSEVLDVKAQCDNILLVPVFVIESDEEVSIDLIKTSHAGAHQLDFVRFENSQGEESVLNLLLLAFLLECNIARTLAGVDRVEVAHETK